MIPFPPIPVFQPYGQRIILLLAALNDAGVSLSRREAVQSISEQGWFALDREDWAPYPSQQSSREPRWKTWIAWGRKDSVLRGLVTDFERDSWSLSRIGHERWDFWRSKFASGEWDVTRGFLWTAKFKRMLCPPYQPGPQDAVRPTNLYRDLGSSSGNIAELEEFIAELHRQKVGSAPSKQAWPKTPAAAPPRTA